MNRNLKRSIIGLLAAVAVATPVAVVNADAKPGNSDSDDAAEVRTAVVNAAETFYGPDNDETTDLWHVTYRTIKVMPQKPDVILLQEVNKQSVKNLLYELEHHTGQAWAAAAEAYPGSGSPSSDGKSRRTSAIIYNTATMSSPSGLTWYMMTAPEKELSKPDKRVRFNEAPVVQLQHKGTSQKYVFSSVHFWPKGVIKSDRYDFRRRAWSVELKNLIHDMFPGAVPIIGGDFNSKKGSTVFDVWTRTDSGSDHTGVSYQASDVGAVLHILSAGSKFTAARDDEYKSPSGVLTPDPELGQACHALYETKLNKSSDDATRWREFTSGRYTHIDQSKTYDRMKIKGCRYHYYSDHAFVWSQVSP